MVMKRESNERRDETASRKMRQHIFIPDKHWEVLRSMAQKKGVKVSDLIREAIENYITT